MECYDAQAAVSEALDGASLDAATLEAAKQHCRECPECASFVRTLNLLKSVPLPEPPADLADRVMAAVRQEAAAEQALASAVVATGKAGSSGGADGLSGNADVVVLLDPSSSGSTLYPPARRLQRPRPAALAAWIGAAAVLAVSLGTVGLMGVRVMTSESVSKSSQLSLGAASAPTDAGIMEQPSPQVAESVPATETRSTDASAAPNFIVLDGTAYQLVGPTKLEKSGLTRLGTTNTSLDGSAMRARDILGASGEPGVYLEGDQGELLEFQPLERTFENRKYRLQSAELTAFGVWPMMPSDVMQPTSADGSPTFSAAGADSTNVTIYRRTTATIAEGIAVAPGAPRTDPGKGNPNWTWWAPIP